MSKRVSREKGTFCPEKSSEHIKKYMGEHDMDRGIFALECDLDRKTVYALYNAEEKAYSLDTFIQITKKIGGITDYWLGLTEETTIEGRKEELRKESELAEYNAAADEAEEELHRMVAEEIERRRSFFYMCGYRYESIELTAATDFSPDPRPHILTSYADNTRHELTEEQFQDLFNKLQDTINFACYQADRANK